MSGPCKVCVEKSGEIRDILRPFNLYHVDPVGGVKIIAEAIAASQRENQRLRDALAKARALHDEDHALDHFDWGKSFLRAQDIKELNEIPGIIDRALTEGAASPQAQSLPAAVASPPPGTREWRVAMSEWISVKDRLPKWGAKSKPVLIARAMSVHEARLLLPAEEFSWRRADGAWSKADYWQPMPAPPPGNEGGKTK